MLEEIGCGEVGLKIEYLYSLTPRQFHNILEGFRNKEELRLRHLYETTRMIMYAAQSPYADKKFKPEDIMIFPWEKKEKNDVDDNDRVYKSADEIRRFFEEN